MKLNINIYADEVTINNVNSQDNFGGPFHPNNHPSNPPNPFDYLNAMADKRKSYAEGHDLGYTHGQAMGYGDGYDQGIKDALSDYPSDPNPCITDGYVFPGFGELPPKPADLTNSAVPASSAYSATKTNLRNPNPVADNLSASMVVDPSLLKCRHHDNIPKELQQKQPGLPTATPLTIAMDAALFNLLFGSGNGIHVEDGTTFRVSGGGVTVH